MMSKNPNGFSRGSIKSINPKFSMRGWYKDSYRHFLAAKGVKTGRKKRLYKFGSDSPASLHYLARKPRKYMQEAEGTGVPVRLTYADEIRLQAGKPAKFLAAKVKPFESLYEKALVAELAQKQKRDPFIVEKYKARPLSEGVGGSRKYHQMKTGTALLVGGVGGALITAHVMKNKPRKYMAYIPTYVAGDLPLIGADAIGTAGAAVVPLIPVAVTAGALYGGVKLAKASYKKAKGKKRKKKKYRAEKKWLGEVPKKDDFGSPITDEFVDGKTAMGAWGIMSPRTFSQMGVGLGLGKGQKYRKTDKGEWVSEQPETLGKGGREFEWTEKALSPIGREMVERRKRKEVKKYQMVKRLPSQDKYRLYSSKGKNLGTFPSREKALEHERHIQFFKRSRYDPKLGRRVTIKA